MLSPVLITIVSSFQVSGGSFEVSALLLQPSSMLKKGHFQIRPTFAVTPNLILEPCLMVWVDCSMSISVLVANSNCMSQPMSSCDSAGAARGDTV